MDLIFADVYEGDLIDRGILHNYEYDFSFGEAENDFELKIPLTETRLEPGQVVYLNDTEYGGIVDSIKVDTQNQMLIYSGRTWQGIIEGKTIYPRKGESYFTVEGEANAVLAELMERMNLIAGDLNSIPVSPAGVILGVSEENSGIYVSASVQSDSGNYAHGYSFIRDLLFEAGAKPRLINGKLTAAPYTDYANDDDFLVDTDQFTAKRIYNALNHIHCMGSGEWGERYEIDIFTDKNGGIMPFCRYPEYFGLTGQATNTGELTDDSDYYTDYSALAELPDSNPDKKNYDYIIENMQTGVDEIAEIYDYPNASVTYHYIVQDTQPQDWATDLTPLEELNNKEWGFEQYYILTVDSNNNATYKNVSRPDIATGYELQSKKPDDWESNFADYYTSGSGGYTKVASVNEYDPLTTIPDGWYQEAYKNYYKVGTGGNYTKVTLEDYHQAITPNAPADWATNYMNYSYTDDGGQTYKTVKGVKEPDTYTQVGKKKPTGWEQNYSNYYTTNGVTYNQVQGRSVDDYKAQTVKPSDWSTNWKAYYKKSGKNYVQLTNKSAPTWKEKKYYTKTTKTKPPKWDKKTTYYLKTEGATHAPTFVAGQYYTKAKKVPTFVSGQFYKKRNYPNWTTNTYYTAYKYQPIPEWTAGFYYTRHEDHFESLVKGAIQKIQKQNISNELKITLDEKRMYDINDRVGASDEVTGIWAVARITQKTLKIKRGVLTFSYKTGQ